jgi:hypothetical protein
LPAAANDLAGNPSQASTSTDSLVIYNTTTLVWNGNGADDKWTTAANWMGGAAPSPGDNLIFPAVALQMECVNDFPPDVQFCSIVVYGDGYRFLNNSIKSATIEVPKNTVFTAVSIVCDTLMIGTKPKLSWTGGGADNKWSTAANWLGGVAPVPGDNLVFPPGALRMDCVNDYPSSMEFGSIDISGGYHIQNGSVKSGTIEVKANSVFTAVSIVCDTLSIGSPGIIVTPHAGNAVNAATLPSKNSHPEPDDFAPQNPLGETVTVSIALADATVEASPFIAEARAETIPATSANPAPQNDLANYREGEAPAEPLESPIELPKIPASPAAPQSHLPPKISRDLLASSLLHQYARPFYQKALTLKIDLPIFPVPDELADAHMKARKRTVLATAESQKALDFALQSIAVKFEHSSGDDPCEIAEGILPVLNSPLTSRRRDPRA